MRFGLSFLPDANGCDLSASDYYQNALSLAKIADKAGLSTIKMTEHYLHPYGGFCPDPITFLASIATSTKQIRLMTGCILPIFHHPVQIAAKTAMLDVLSGGRLDVGFARAYLPYEFNNFQIPLDESRDRFEHTIDAVIKLWTEKDVSMTNPYFQLDQATSFPKPIQAPHPPIWGAAVMSRQSFAWLGEKGCNLLVTPPLNGLSELQKKIYIYTESFHATYANKSPLICMSMPLLMAEDDHVAIQLSNQYLAKYISVWANALEAWSHHRSNAYPGYESLASKIRNCTPNHMRTHLQALVGCPARVLDSIHDIMKTLNINQLIWQIDFGAQPDYVSQRSLQLFIEEVIPYIEH